MFLSLHKNAKDITGKKYGRLLVRGPVERVRYIKGGDLLWSCLCDCGEQTIASGGNLRSGHTTSCGCYLSERRGTGNRRHQMSRTAEHNTWCEIRRRCEDVKRENYATHGARGIRVCERWQTFENFYADMGPRPSNKHTIERINNDGHYEPGNCKWATHHEQGLNRRNNFIVTAFGKTAPLGYFLPITDANSEKAYKRAHERIMRGWDAERAITEPPRKLRGASC